MKRTLAVILILLFAFRAAYPDITDVKTIQGVILKIKKDKPYPFPRRQGVIWECKMRIGYIEEDPDGDRDLEVYKAYPINHQMKWMCDIPEDTVVYMTVMSKGEYRGEIIDLQIIEPTTH